MILRENSEWLRYVLWGCAIGCCFLVAGAVRAPETDAGKMIGAVMGVLLFGFSGFVFKTRKIEIDPVRSRITITRRGFRDAAREVIEFSEVERIVLVKTFYYDEELASANRWHERWNVVLQCTDRVVPVTQNPAVRKEDASRTAGNIQRILGVGISDSDEESIRALVRTGRKADAITVAVRSLGMTTTEAREYVGKLS